MKEKETTAAKKKKRWRPTKKFISKKSDYKREKPWRPRKDEKLVIQLPEIPEKKENKTKDKIIFVIFIISFLIFCFSIFVSQKDFILNMFWLTKTTIQAKNPDEIPNEIDTDTTQIKEEIFTWWIKEIKNIKELILTEFYQKINNWEFENVYNNIDTPLKRSETFKKIFAKSWLERFLNNIDQKTVGFTILSIEEKKTNYQIQYAINQNVFTEIREAEFIERENWPKISKIMCITTWCSTLPFFNPGKYFK